MRKPNSLRSAMARRASMRQSPKDSSTNSRNLAAAGSKRRFNSKQAEALKEFSSKTSSSPVRATPTPTMKTPPKPTSGTTKPISRLAKRLRRKK